MRKPKFVLTLDSDRYDLIIYSLIEMKNRLTREGRYTDAVDDALIELLSVKPKRRFFTFSSGILIKEQTCTGQQQLDYEPRRACN